VRLPTLLRLAEVPRVDDLTKLTGQSLPLAVYSKPTHEATARVQQALTNYRLVRGDTGKGAPPAVDTLRTRLDEALRCGELRATCVLKSVRCCLVCWSIRNGPLAYLTGLRVGRHLWCLRRLSPDAKLLAYQPVPELAWLVADRGMAVTQEADDPVAIAGSAWYLARLFHHVGILNRPSV
jgi:hypothetical protein